MSTPTFEHRHFKVIARIIADMEQAGYPQWAGPTAHHFADCLAKTNPRFNRERFLSAAKGEPSNGRDKVRS